MAVSRRMASTVLRNPRARRWAALGVLATLAGSALQLVWIVALASVIDRVFLDGAGLRGAGAALVVMGLAVALRAGCAWSAEVALERSAARVRMGVRSEVTAALAAGPRECSEGVGEATTTLVDNVEDLALWVRRYLPAHASLMVVPILVLATTLVLDPPTTLVLLFAGPMLVLLLAVIGRRTAAAASQRAAELGWLGTLYLDMLRGLVTLRAFGRTDDGAEAIEDASRRLGNRTMEVLRTTFQTSLVMEWAATAATALVAVQVSFRLVGGRLGFGTALAVLVLTPEFFVPFRRLAVEYHAGQAGRAALERIEQLLEHQAAADTAPGPTAAQANRRAPGETGTRVSLRDVWLTRSTREEPALRGLDLEVGPGETVALVGPSGGGKSTVAALLLGFLHPERGEILVDGRPLDGLDMRSWRSSVAWVPQSPTIFSGTVAHNIALGEPDAPPEAIRRAARSAGLAEVIESLPDGYDTVLGEGGTELSGGQRQRLAIARALLRDAPLVILDEFTAHLDDATELAVLDATGRLLDGRTAILVAHRPATARIADRTVRVEHGRVVDPERVSEVRP